MTDRRPMQLRLPADLKAWIAAQAEKNASSQNSEVIRAVRERMDRESLALTGAKMSGSNQPVGNRKQSA